MADVDIGALQAELDRLRAIERKLHDQRVAAGQAGGKARARKLSYRTRKEQARKAAAARWRKAQP